MKKILLLTLICLASLQLQAQTDGISYQAVIVGPNNTELPGADAQGNILPNTTVAVKFTILDANNSTEYQEIQTTNTDQYGRINLIIGSIDPDGFALISWDGTAKDLKVEIDFSGSGNNYVDMSRQELTFTPYAYHRNITAAGTLTVDDASFLNGELMVQGPTILNSTLSVNNGNVTNLSGLLNVEGNTDLKSNLNVDGIANLNNSLNVKNHKLTYLSGDLIVGDSTFSPIGSALFNGPTAFKGSSEFTNLSVEGNARIKGTTTIDSTATINGITTINNNSNLNGQVKINFDTTGTDNDVESYPLLVKGNNQGIAIKVSETTVSTDNNYVTFFDGSNIVKGRIEGETNVNLLLSPEYIFDNAVFAADIFITSGELIIAIAEEVQAIAEGVTYGLSENVCFGGGVGLGAVAVSVVCPPQLSEAVTVVSNIVLQSANLALVLLNEAEAIAIPVAYNIFKHTQIGVTYQSGAGDYAEWLQKNNLSEVFYPGDVVGVNAGRISHNTNNAQNIMVISSNPIVLGNMPDKGKENEFEKVAFMGQVPVKVNGIVSEGDYILPSGKNDGFAIAVKSDGLSASDYKNIIGIAWSSSNTNQLNYVNVAVGINANDISQLVINQDSKINQQELDILELKERLEKIENLLINGGEFEQIIASKTESNKTNTVPEHEPSVTFKMITNELLVEGIEMAKQRLIDKGIDVDNHPFFKKMDSEPRYKENYISKIINGYETEIEKRSKSYKKDGIKVYIE